MRRAGLRGRLLLGDEFKKRSGISFYEGGIVVEDNYIMHPGLLMKGLLENLIAQGVPVYENSPVIKETNTDSSKETNILETPEATVAAKKVLFAANAYTPRLNGLLSSRMVPVVLATVATEPLSDSQIKAAGFEWRHLTEIQLLSRTIGHTPDNRVYLRGIAGYSSFNSCLWKDLEGVYKRLEKELRERVPWTRELKITRRWPGAVAMTYSSIPIAGPLPGKGRFVCAAYNGHGMAQGFYHGRLTAHLMLGENHPDLKFLRGPSETGGWIPPEPYRSIGAKTFFFFAL